MTQIAINTSQNVNIDFTLASVGDRIAAYIIDIFIKVAYLLQFLFYCSRFLILVLTLIASTIGLSLPL